MKIAAAVAESGTTTAVRRTADPAMRRLRAAAIPPVTRPRTASGTCCCTRAASKPVACEDDIGELRGDGHAQHEVGDDNATKDREAADDLQRAARVVVAIPATRELDGPNDDGERYRHRTEEDS